MTEMTHEEACEALNEVLRELGRKAARRVMTMSVAELLEPDEMEHLVDEEVDWHVKQFMAGGIPPEDVEIGIGILREALVKEGKRIAMGLGTEVGSA